MKSLELINQIEDEVRDLLEIYKESLDKIGTFSSEEVIEIQIESSVASHALLTIDSLRDTLIGIEQLRLKGGFNNV